MAAKQIPEEVKNLIDYLRSTGTGESKLTAIEGLAFQCTNLSEFMTRLDSVVTNETVTKAKKYLEQLPAIKEAMKAPLKQEITETTETTTKVTSVTRPVKETLKGKAKDAQGNTIEPSTDDEPSEVADLTVQDAKDAIARMRSTDKLTHITMNDTRATVQKAASDRLEELKATP